jgi:trigger factor
MTELPESRVRLQVQVPPGELELRLERKARELGAKLKIPGFRRGKVPPPIVIRRIGREAVLEEAVRDTLPLWYADALQNSKIVPVGDPQVDLGELPPQGQALRFSIEIGVLPKATLGRYKGLEVGRREPQLDPQRLDQELEALRERLARLETAERAAATGDFVVIDYEGQLAGQGEQPSSEASVAAGGAGSKSAPGAAGSRAASPAPRSKAAAEQAKALADALNGRDQLVELGAGRLPEELERALLGAAAGDRRTVQVAFPEQYGNSPLAGRQATLEVTVKEVKAKQLPDLDDDLAIDAGFEDLEELRGDIDSRLQEAERREVESEFRQAALDAAVQSATVEVPAALVQARAKEMWERMLHSLAHRGLSREAYLQIDGRREEDILAELAPDAERALRREAVITAVVETERIQPDDQELEQALAGAAGEQGRTAAELLGELRGSGRLEELREDLAARAAMDLIAEQATPIAPELAKAREQIWTPEGEEAAKGAAKPAGQPGQRGQEAGQQQPGQAGARLWTPDR